MDRLLLRKRHRWHGSRAPPTLLDVHTSASKKPFAKAVLRQLNASEARHLRVVTWSLSMGPKNQGTKGGTLIRDLRGPF